MRGFLLNGFLTMFLYAPEPDGGGGGGGAPPAGDPPDAAAELAALKAENAALKAAAGKAKPPGDPKPADPLAPEPGDLAAAAAHIRKQAEDRNNDTRQLESAIRFTMGAKDWAKTHEALLPKTVVGIMEAADKEIYTSSIEKSQAIKAALVQEFFSQQTNLDLLTGAQKIALEDFNKLAKTVRHERVGPIFDTVFEPTFEMIKRVRKAEQVATGLHTPREGEAAYNAKMKAISKKAYLRS